MIESSELSQFYIDALGCACLVSEFGGDPIPQNDQSIAKPGSQKHFDEIPPLATYLDKVTRMAPQPLKPVTSGMQVFVGFDIGSTGSKAMWIWM